MRARTHSAAVAALLTLLLTALVLLVPVPGAVAATVTRTLNDTRPVTSGVVEVSFAIEHFGVVGTLASRRSHLSERGVAPYGEARFRTSDGWTSWRRLEQDGAQQPGHFTSALLSVDRATAYQVRALPAAGHRWRAAALNTSDGPTEVTGLHPPGAAVAAPACLSRADWGADESLSGWARGDQQEYFPVQALTVHHTAGSNDLGQDYAATVRAIYSYHVQSNGWSDIGYQYLVDGLGRVYEGRSSGETTVSCRYAGGDGSDFAHQSGTDHVVTGAHVAGYNSGNVGVALMGCFESTAECTGNTDPPAAAVDGVEELLASLADRHCLSPQGSVHYVNPKTGATKDLPTISGHRDWEATACPGGKLYGMLPALRSAVAARLAPTPPASITSASCQGRSCTFTGTGTPVLRWRFGNGTSATGSPVTATYSARGSYTVRLTDGQGRTATRVVSCRRVDGRLRCTT